MNTEKILFISHDPFSEVGSNGKTYLSLFSEFKDNEIAQLYFNRLQPSSTIFNNFFKVTDIDILKYLFTFSFWKITGKVQKENIENIKAPVIRRRSLLKSELIKLLRNFLFSIVKVHSLGAFKSWIEEFKPTVIFCVCSNYKFAYEELEQISKKYNIPYYIYFTDDYFIYNNGKNFITNFIHKRFVEKSKKVVEGAEELFVIGPKMKQEYEKYFNKKSTILINAVNIKSVESIKTELNNPTIFRYFGWLHSNRSSSLRHLGECLKYINDNYNRNCILEVYTLSEPNGKTKIDLSIETIKICKPVKVNELRSRMLSSDFLVHAESFEQKDTQIMMLSTSTKIPEYLLSNCCIVAIGPLELSSINLVKENKLGIVLSNKKLIKDDAQEIYTVMNNMNMYNDYCRKSIEYCERTFNASEMRKVLKSKLLKN